MIKNKKRQLELDKIIKRINEVTSFYWMIYIGLLNTLETLKNKKKLR